jgi:tetratricopeptide (TPR) repeat protein
MRIMSNKGRIFGFLASAAVLVLVLTSATLTRNRVFHDPISFWADATGKSPEKQRTHHNYGCALSAAELHEAALQEFRKTLAMKPDGSILLGYLLTEMGVSYYKLEQYDNAIRTWQEALHGEPNSAELLNDLAMAFLKKKQYARARNYAEHALKLEPSMADTMNTLGQIHLALGDPETAIHWFLLAVEKEPEVISRYWDLIEVLEKTGRYAMALEYAGRVAMFEQDYASQRRAHKYMDSIKKNVGALPSP